MVPDAPPYAGGVQVFAKDQSPRFAQWHLLSDLQRAQVRDGLEMVVEARRTQAHVPRESVDARRAVKVLPQTFHSPRNAVSMTTKQGKVPQPIAMLTEQPILPDSRGPDSEHAPAPVPSWPALYHPE